MGISRLEGEVEVQPARKAKARKKVVRIMIISPLR